LPRLQRSQEPAQRVLEDDIHLDPTPQPGCNPLFDHPPQSRLEAVELGEGPLTECLDCITVVFLFQGRHCHLRPIMEDGVAETRAYHHDSATCPRVHGAYGKTITRVRFSLSEAEAIFRTRQSPRRRSLRTFVPHISGWDGVVAC